MLHFSQIVFGPIHSRRLGSSLGVNLLPVSGKLCNFDCVYCECGWNKDGISDRVMPKASDVAAALEDKLLSNTEPIDSITFSGNGEPTLNPEFPKIIDAVLALRDKYCPTAKVSVLSNASTLSNPAIREALRRIDNPILKIDAPFSQGVEIVNRPTFKYDIDKIIANLEAFNGDFVLQTMFLHFPQFDTKEYVGQWMDLVRRLKPRQTMVYTLDRETPEKDLEKYSSEQMRQMVQPLLDEGYNVTISG